LLAHRSALTLIVIPFIASTLYGQALFNKPVTVLGDPNFIGTAADPLIYDSPGPNWVEGREVNSPGGIALDNSVSPPIVYIADTGNNRVLAYQYATQLTAGSYADLILGQPNQYTTLREGPGTSFSTGLNAPTGLAVDAMGNLYVADSGDNRILRYPKPFSQPSGYQFPDFRPLLQAPARIRAASAPVLSFSLAAVFFRIPVSPSIPRAISGSPIPEITAFSAFPHRYWFPIRTILPPIP
jgi:NHL repeat